MTMKKFCRLLRKRQAARYIHNSLTAESSTVLPKLSQEEQVRPVLAPIGKSLVDYNHFINDFAKERKPSEIRELNKLYGQKEMISFAGGLPNPETFPFRNIHVTLKDNTTFTIEGKSLYDSLQYLPSQGYPPLLEKLRQIQQKNHAPPLFDQSDIIITPGSQDGLHKAIEMSLEPGEPIIIQSPVYTGATACLRPYKADIIAVEQDEHGMRPDLLRRALERRWTPHQCFLSKKGVPKLIYLNTTGANPTGVALSTERKQEIYQLACEYNLLILEDDPYYYLHFQDENPTSFLSLDTEGRVIRFDSFSKIMSPGLRLGFVTAPLQIIKRMEIKMQADTLHSSSLSQILVDQVLETWGYDRLEEHFQSIRDYYKNKRDMMVEAADRHLKGLAEWNVPTAGMFVWIKVKDIPDVLQMVTQECMKRGVMFVTGHAFQIDKQQPCAYLRACYTLPTAQQIDEGMKRLGEVIVTEQNRYSQIRNMKAGRLAE